MEVLRRSVTASTSMERTSLPTKVLLSEDPGERESYSCFDDDAEETVADDMIEMVAVADPEGDTAAQMSMYEVLRRQRSDDSEAEPVVAVMMRQRRRLACSSPGYSSFVDDLENDDEGACGAVSFPRSASSSELRKRKRTVGHPQEPTIVEPSGSGIINHIQGNETREDADTKRKRVVHWEVDDVQALVQRSLDFSNVDKSETSAMHTQEDYTSLFKRWLNMKQKDEVDEELVASARGLQPENLYQHFEEFLPYNPEDYDMKVQYERACAERALKEAKERSWLLRRSSYNRRFNGNFKVSPKAQGPMANSMRMSNDSALVGSSLSFYAFSYKKPNKTIGHLLCVKFGDSNKWAFASSSGVNIELEAFYDHFVDLLAFMLRCTGSLPKRVVLGYLTLEALTHGK